MINSEALDYWKQCGHSAAKLLEVCKVLDEKYLCLKIDFSPEKPLAITVSNWVAKQKQGHFYTVAKFFEELSQLPESRHLKGSILVWLEDGMWDFTCHFSRNVPILAFGRSCWDKRTLLIPDPAYMETYGYLTERAENKAVDEKVPWEKKIPAAVWRGTGSGLGMHDDTWRDIPRVRLSMISAKLGDPSKLDAFISRPMATECKGYLDGLRELELLRDYRPFKEFLDYKYQIDVDGICCAWIACFLKLAADPVLLKVQSQYIQWYYDRLKAWEHYVPVMPDMSDLVDLIDWLRNNDEAAREISRRATSLVESITYDKELRATAAMLSELLATQRE